MLDVFVLIATLGFDGMSENQRYRLSGFVPHHQKIPIS
jgi:hypothetical protein